MSGCVLETSPVGCYWSYCCFVCGLVTLLPDTATFDSHSSTAISFSLCSLPLSNLAQLKCMTSVVALIQVLSLFAFDIRCRRRCGSLHRAHHPWHGALQWTSNHLRPEQPDQQGWMHCGTGLHIHWGELISSVQFREFPMCFVWSTPELRCWQSVLVCEKPHPLALFERCTMCSAKCTGCCEICGGAAFVFAE